MNRTVLFAFVVAAHAARSFAADKDTDGDGLSDFAEVHKYFTDPAKKDTDDDGIPDGDPYERREYAYSVRTLVRVMKPYDLAAMNDDYQDARLLQETDEYGEIEVTHYPLNTVVEGIVANAEWKTADASVAQWLKPGIATNSDAVNRDQLINELKEAGIDPDRLTDRDLAEKTARWMLKTTSSPGYMFTTYFMDFSSGKPVLLPGCERAYEREKGKAGWTFDEQLQHELLGAGMFATKTRGTCTSSAVYWTTVLRALCLPTRMVLCIPALDGNDKAQLQMIEDKIKHHRVRETMKSGIEKARGFSAHTFNEVFIGGRWVRLNYGTLGQSNLDEHYFGLLTHTLTFHDLSDANLAATWGKRYALGERSAELPTSNPFRTLELSDLFGMHAKIENPAVRLREDHQLITIKNIIWADSPQFPAWVALDGEKSRQSGYVFAVVEPEESFPDQDYRQYRRFLDAADLAFTLEASDGARLPANLTGGFYTQGRECYMSFVVGSGDFDRMVKGKAYRLVPSNTKPKAPKWAVKDGVTLTRSSP